MTPYLIGGAAIASLFVGWTVRDWKADSDALAAQNAANARYDEVAAELSARSVAYEELAQSIRARSNTDRVEIREIFRDVEVPENCAAPDAVIGVLDNAVRRANAAATGQPIDALPDPTPTPEATERPGPR